MYYKYFSNDTFPAGLRRGLFVVCSVLAMACRSTAQHSPANNYAQYIHDTRTYGIWYNRGRFDSALSIPLLTDTITTPQSGVPQIFALGTGPNSFYYYDGHRSYNIVGRDTTSGPFVQLNPASPQSGFFNVTGNCGIGGSLTMSNSVYVPNNTPYYFRNVQNTANVLGTALGTSNLLYFYDLNNHIDSADNLLIGGTISSNKTVNGLQVIGVQPGNGQNAAVMARASNFSDIAWSNTGAGTDQKTWDLSYNTTGNTLSWRTITDANAAATSFFVVTRGSGTTVSSIAFPSTAPVGVGTGSPAAQFHTVGTLRHDLGSDAPGDIYYRSAGANTVRLGIGSPGQYLTVSPSSLPQWSSLPGGGKVDTVFSVPSTFTTGATTATPVTGLLYTAPAGKVGLYAFEVYLNTSCTGSAGIFIGLGGTFTGGMNNWAEGGSTGASVFAASQTTTNGGLTATAYNNYTGNGWLKLYGTVVFVGAGETLQVVVATGAGSTISILPAGTFMRVRQL